MPIIRSVILSLFGLLLFAPTAISQSHSVARELNEIVLTGIRNDFARPTVHARNLFHSAIAMYDVWAIYDGNADPYLIGQSLDGFESTLEDFPMPTDIKAATEEAMAFAVYRIVFHRYRFSPDWSETEQMLDQFMIDHGYDSSITSIDYTDGTPAHLGNYVGEIIIDFGLQDGSNENGFYRNTYYEAVNEPLVMKFPGNPDMVDPNRWQPISVDVFIDQSGNEVPSGATEFLSPEWGNVKPFSLTEDDKTTYMRDGDTYQVYLDPGAPWYIDTIAGELDTEAYQWGFSMVASWAAHLDPADGVMIDISPASFGNVDIDDYPESFEEYKTFYDFMEGGDIGQGRPMNPTTGQPYPPNVVARGDYARVLAEFWADGPDSETPPGHWFTILNYVVDHPQFERKYRGEGPLLDTLEWDVKAYLVMGGAMHDCAIAAWGVKGYYDYLRPVSALRYMCERGQSTNMSDTTYDVAGIPLIDGRIEIVSDMSDPLADGGNNLGKVKFWSWKGPDFIQDPETDVAGVGWILGENWWPYQRPSFVTPPFAGYVSGHSTYSRAAAEVLTLITGDEYFPGGVGEFLAEQNEFLVFEDGPSTDITLQWATYRDASDQTSLSRIWGGIHPPIDDIPGRKMGDEIGKRAVEKAEEYFNISTSIDPPIFAESNLRILQNPLPKNLDIEILTDKALYVNAFQLFNLNGQLLHQEIVNGQITNWNLPSDNLSPGMYFLKVISRDKHSTLKVIIH